MSWFSKFRLWLAGFPQLDEGCVPGPFDLDDFAREEATGTCYKVRNKHAKNNSSSEYYVFRLRDNETGETGIFAMTPKQMEQAKSRAEKNSEDIPKDIRDSTVEPSCEDADVI